MLLRSVALALSLAFSLASPPLSLASASTAAKSFDARDKVVLVTGSNRGIGLAIIEGFLEAGAGKAYAGVRTLSTADSLVETYGSRVVPLHIDLADPATIKRAAEIAQDVDLVVNNAGVLDVVDPFEDEDAYLESLEKQMNVNFLGLVHMAQEFGPVLERGGGGGSFVQINSVASLQCPGASISGYAASKAAAFSFTQGLRGGLPNTLVLSVHPGPIATDMIDKINLRDMSEPPEVVFKAILQALEKGDQFMVFPDAFSKNMGEDYKDFAKKHITGSLGY